jgi:capsular polysaccharide biosynthesis protein
MSDDAELSISELRRKRAQVAGGGSAAGGAAGGQQSTPDPVRRVNEPVIIETTPRYSPGAHAAAQPQPQPVYAQPAPQVFAATEENKPLPFDPWRIPTALKKRWLWLLIAGVVMCLLGGVAGYFRAKYFSRITFTLRDLSAPVIISSDGDAYKPRQIAQQTMINFLNSAPLMRRVSASSTNPLITDRQLFSRLTIVREKDSDNVAVTVSGRKVQDIVNLANLYASNALELSRETMSQDPINYCALQSNNLVSLKLDIDGLNAQMSAYLKTNSIVRPDEEQQAHVKQYSEDQKVLNDLRFELNNVLAQLQGGSANTNAVSPEVIARGRDLQDAKDQLRKLIDKGLLDAHSDVIRAKALVARREQELADARKSAASPSSSPADSELLMKRDQLRGKVGDYEARVAKSKSEVERISPLIVGYLEIKAHIESDQKAQRNSQNRLSEAQQYLKGALGYYDPPNPISYKDVETHTRSKTAITYGVMSGFLGVFLTIVLVLLLEITDSRLKTAADVKRVTELPVLASLGDLTKMDEEARKAWAFRTWTILSGTLSKSANRGTVCGLISCAHGEGRTTWVEMLVDAARQRGFEVTKLDFGKADDRAKYESGAANDPADSSSEPSIPPGEQTGNPSFSSAAPPGSPGVPATAANLKMMQAKAASVIHVQLPGLVWNLERRIQFNEELEKWQTVSSAVILIDLPPASVPEAILLAENLPQVLWLVDSGKSRAAETRLHLETLRHARCKLVGAVLNREPVPLMKL